MRRGGGLSRLVREAGTDEIDEEEEEGLAIASERERENEGERGVAERKGESGG